jgi:mono/diheme cytochrome c family protein
LKDTARIEPGRQRFGSTCAACCHGNEGSGGKATAFRGREDIESADAYKVISDGGRGADIMPPWGTAFTLEETRELVAYLQHLSTLPAK